MNLEFELMEAYFESNGFLIRQANEPVQTSGKKKNSDLPTMAIFNPLQDENDRELGFRLFTGDLSRIRAALVSLLGWGNSSFSNDCFNNDARLSKFFKSEVANEKWSLNVQPGSSLAERGMGEFLRLLVVPNFPRSESKIKIVTELLQKAGVDGVLTLSAILENLLRQTLPSGGSPSHSVFYLLGLLKAYDLVKEPQLDMFED